MSAPLYTLPQVARIVDVEYRTLHNWLRAGHVVPTVRESTGSGSANLLNATDVLRCKVLADLRHAGFSMEGLASIAVRLTNLSDAELELSGVTLPIGFHTLTIDLTACRAEILNAAA